MKHSTAQLAMLAGMVGGPTAAIDVIQRENDHILGEAKNNTLFLPRPHDKKTLETTKEWGFVWPENEDIAYDRHMPRSRDLTIPVTVPNGWSLKATDHYLYKNLLDPKGQVRGTLMIHTQDHDSWLGLVEKYRVSYWQKAFKDTEPYWPVIEDSNGKVLWVGTKVDAEPDYHTRMKQFWKDHHAGKNPGEVEPKSPMTKATDLASLQLREWDINPADPKWFDQGFDFPPLNDTRPVVQKYRFNTEYRHRPDDQYAADSGSSELLAADDAEAIAEMEAKRKQGSSYHCNWRLFDPKGKEIWRGESPRPKPKNREVCFYDGKYGYATRPNW